VKRPAPAIAVDVADDVSVTRRDVVCAGCGSSSERPRLLAFDERTREQVYICPTCQQPFVRKM
jgi:predicted SprT family Zn-dependent metalloprotease